MASTTIIITGAGGGIGRCAAVELAGSGSRLVLVGRTQSTLEESAGKVREAGGEALMVAADITNPDESLRIVAAALKQFGTINAVVNNAGYAPVLGMEEMSIVEWQRIIDTNLSAAFYLSKAAWGELKRSAAQSAGVEGAAGATIVNISSEASRDPFKGLTAYGAAKAGLNLLGLSLAREGAEFGIRVHTLAPAAVETQMLRGIINREQVPESKTLDPAAVGRVIAACIRGDLRYTSGEIIYLHQQP